MKQYIKNIMIMAALLLASTGAWAGGSVTTIIQKMGTADANAGTVEYSIANSVCTLTVTPAAGNYMTAEYLTVVKVVDGSAAQARSLAPELNTATIAVTAVDNQADPSSVTSYTFAIPSGDYDFEVTANFQARTDISKAVISLAEETFTYDGQAKQPAIESVALGNITLSADDYTVAYSNNTVPTLASDELAPTVTITGQGIYTGTASATFNIEAGQAVVATAPVAIENLVYTGSAQALVTAGSATNGTMKYSLDKEDGYSTDVPTATDAGSYKVYYKVEGDSNYNGTEVDSVSVSIAQAKPVLAFTPTAATYVFGAEFEEPVLTNESEVTVTYSIASTSETTVATIDAETGKVTAVAPGTATVTATYAGDNNHEGTSASYTLTVEAGESAVTTAPVAIENLVYTGAAQALVTAGSATNGTIKYSLDKEDGYSTDVPTATDAGSYKVYYKVEGDANYNGTEVDSVSVSIAQAKPVLAFTPTAATYVFGTEFEEPVLTNESEVTVTYSIASTSETTVATVNETTGKVTAVAPGTATVTATYEGDTNHEGTSASYTLTVEAGQAVVATAPVAIENLVYTGKAQALVTAGSAVNGTMKYSLDKESFSTDVPTATNAGDYTVYYLVEGAANYNNSDTLSIKVSIAKATPTVTAPVAKTLTYTGEAQELVEAGSSDFGTVVYSLEREGTYSESIPTAIEAGDYTVYYAVMESGNYFATDTASVSVTIEQISIDISEAVISLAEETFTYDGQTKQPAIESVVLGDITLSANDYTVAYSNNTEPALATDEQAPTVTITGQGIYTGESTATFTIERATVQLSFSAATASAVYGQVAEMPTLQNQLQLPVSYESADEQVATVDETGAVTLLGAGTTTITAKFAGNSHYIRAAAKYELTVTGPATGLAFAQEVVTAQTDEQVALPTLQNPNNLPVTYSSWNTKVATVDASTGSLTIVGAGSTTIMARFAGSDKFLPDSVSYRLELTTPTRTLYDVWIGNVQVTSDNWRDVLGDMAQGRQAPSVFFQYDTNTLVLADAELAQSVTTQLADTLTVFLRGDSKISVPSGAAISQTNGAGHLLFMTDGNYPGSLTLISQDGSSVVKGFADMVLQNSDAEDQKLALTVPAKGGYRDGQLRDSLGIAADTATIAFYIKPLDKTVGLGDVADEVKEQLNDDTGVTNVVIDNSLLVTGTGTDVSYNGNEECIELAPAKQESEAFSVIGLLLIPGTPEYAASFSGITFMVPAGKGRIVLYLQIPEDNTLHLDIFDSVKLDFVQSLDISSDNNGLYTVNYEVSHPSFVLIYNITENEARGIGNRFRIGKKTTAQIKIYSVSVVPEETLPATPVKSVAQSYPVSFLPPTGQALETYPDDDPVVEPDPGPSTGIVEAKQASADGVWFNLSGQRVYQPSQKGIYIYKGRKVKK